MGALRVLTQFVRFPLLLLWLLLLVGLSCRALESDTPTFARDVAPIVFENCAPCHRMGGVAPFPLTDYEEARRRSRQIAEVTSSGYMPPWLPAPLASGASFDGERRLSPSQVEVLARWAEAEAPEGDPAELPPVPESVNDWELGEPDLILEMTDAFALPAEGPDVFRNFVLPVPLEGPRFVEAIELLPSERRLVHHATITIDRGRASRRLDAADPEPGFSGMRAAPGAVMPDGHFLGWTPGKAPRRERSGMSWRLEPRSDLVVQLHMPTTGKPERVGLRIGFHFTSTPPSVVPATIRLGSRQFEIPAGARDFPVEDEYVLPVDARAVAIYPHAHYLARQMQALALFPDGTSMELLHIDDWDFNWQDFYRYREPIALPRGTVLRMRFTFDNSDDNPRNPNRPARTVSYGPESRDEMVDLYIQLVPARGEELDLLRGDFTAKELKQMLLELGFYVERKPDDADLLNSLGVVYERLGRTDEAIASFRASLRRDPDSFDGHFNLGTLLAARGERALAIQHFRAVLTREPDCVDCSVRLGNVLRDEGKLDDAIGELTRALARDPDYAWAHYSRGIALQLQGRIEEAIVAYRRVVELEPSNTDARLSLGSALAGERRCTAAVAELERAARLEPDWAEPLSRLAWALTICPSAIPDAGSRAVDYARRAVALSAGDDPHALATLGDALAGVGQSDEAVEAWSRALELAERRDARLAGDLRQKLAELGGS